MKLFKTNNIEVVELCQYQFGFEKPSVLWKKRVSAFNVQFDTSDNAFCTRSSSVVTLSRPRTISLKITDRSFRYPSSRLWNQLPDSFRQPHHSSLDSPPHPLLNSSLSLSTLLTSITPSLFHSWLKTYLFNQSFPP